MSGTSPERSDAKALVPKRPPGRSSRKARGFALQIRELQARGYTLDAIREALSEAGVVVSRSTVHREANRGATPVAVVASVSTDTSLGPSMDHDVSLAGPDPPALTAGVDPPWVQADNGKDIAAAFMNGRVTNLLIRAKQRAKERP